MDARKICETAVLDALGVSNILWSTASLIALSHHTEAVMRSPSVVLKATEWWLWTQRVNPLIAVPRYLAHGTTEAPNFDVMQVESDVGAIARTRASLYADMCRNCFTALGQGPGQFKRYLEHVEERRHGLMIANNQFFDAVRQQNDDIRDAIDLFRRRVYAVRVGCEVAMVVLGAFAIPVLIQIGVGLGYVLVTNVITHWAGMEKADIVAMPGKVTKSSAAGVAGNLAQEATDIVSDQFKVFENAQQLAYAREQARIERRIAEIIAEGKKRGGNRGELKRLLRLRAATGHVAEAAKAGHAEKLASGAARVGVRLGGIAVGLYFMKEDLKNMYSFYEEGALFE